MKATLKTAQMGLAAGVVVEVVNRGVRACVVQGAAKEVSVTVPTEDLVFEGENDGPPAPEPLYDPETDPAVRDEDGNVVMNDLEDADLDENPAEPHFSTAPSDLDEPAFDPDDKSLLVNILAEPKKKKAAKKKVAKDADA